MNEIKVYKLLMLVYQIFGILGEILTVLLTPDSNFIQQQLQQQQLQQQQLPETNDHRVHTENSIKVASSLNSAIKTAIIQNNRQYERLFPTFIPTIQHAIGSVEPQHQQQQQHLNNSKGVSTNTTISGSGQIRKIKRDKRIVVTLDGGGMRGIATLKVLQELSKQLNFDIIERADMVGGTSTGSIIAFGRTKGLEYHEIVEIYRNFGKNIFQGMIKNFISGATLANSEKKRQELKNVFGDQLLGEFSTHKKVFAVVSKVRQTTDQQSVFEPTKFSNYNKKHEDVTVTQAIDSSSAAPVFFKPCEVKGQKFCDGGILQNNPILISHREAQKQFGDKVECIFISLGTGLSPDQNPNNIIQNATDQVVININEQASSSTTTTTTKTSLSSKFEILKNSVNNSLQNSPGAKLQETIKHTMGVIKTAQASIGDSETAHQIFKQMKKTYRNFSYYRFNPVLTQNYTLADYSKSSIKSMQQDALDYMNSAETVQLIQQLKEEIESINSSF
ncbi:patatin family protein [Tieghemostelium lacteum]|uniref:Patatin family protein n=1 Tax=Tieghemostelium lacteum TaxID=361077 RepID=A0A151Z345_TIELA|nr:patatin family protein [Tieghemostelium lacteum]|eukprot:KYQ88234.1 patatin family protein [Tieghemostelium lacteum]